jgi:excisionase family DNA binding protein
VGIEVIDALVIPPEAVTGDSADTGWAVGLQGLVAKAAAEGKTVRVSVEERTYTPRQAAERLGVSRATVQRRVENGQISALTRGGRHHIAESELRRYQEAAVLELARFLANDF